MDNEIREKLLERAKKYKEYQLQLFIDETGWEDWMESFLEEKDFYIKENEPLTEQMTNVIDKELTEIFKEVHRN